jgi:molecular chaperone GrpE
MPSSPASEDDRGQVAQAAATEPATEGHAESDADALREANAQLEDRYKRALADLDNYRKRSAREVDRRVAESRESQMRDWLEVVDGLDRALRMAEPENPMAQGLRAVLDQMEAILARQGVERIGRAGEQFDPIRHEAVGVREANDVPDRTVLDVTRSGFASGDRVVRPAEVIVSRRDAREG